MVHLRLTTSKLYISSPKLVCHAQQFCSKDYCFKQLTQGLKSQYFAYLLLIPSLPSSCTMGRQSCAVHTLGDTPCSSKGLKPQTHSSQCLACTHADVGTRLGVVCQVNQGGNCILGVCDGHNGARFCRQVTQGRDGSFLFVRIATHGAVGHKGQNVIRCQTEFAGRIR